MVTNTCKLKCSTHPQALSAVFWSHNLTGIMMISTSDLNNLKLTNIPRGYEDIFNLFLTHCWIVYTVSCLPSHHQAFCIGSYTDSSDISCILHLEPRRDFVHRLGVAVDHLIAAWSLWQEYPFWMTRDTDEYIWRRSQTPVTARLAAVSTWLEWSVLKNTCVLDSEMQVSAASHCIYLDALLWSQCTLIVPQCMPPQSPPSWLIVTLCGHHYYAVGVLGQSTNWRVHRSF